ncbi:MAG: polysaccharide pyruvyl transferase family protein [Aquamicrobium sp.]|nr:polysaccharide pyruvyl transferase family protein [Aquamicrobium sp.]
MKIVLFGQFGCGNTGNDGSLKAMADLLRDARPNAEIVCACPNPAVVEADLGIPAIATSRPAMTGRIGAFVDRMLFRLPGRVVRLMDPIRQLRKADLMLVPGTGFLDDFQEVPRGWPLMILRWSLAARLVGARLAFVGIGAGPIRHPMSRFFMTMAARLCHFRSYRDTPSRDFMAELGIGRGTDQVCPDVAFALTPPPDRLRPVRPSLAVGVGVMSYSGWVNRNPDSEEIYDLYISKIVSFVGWLLEKGHDVRLLTGDIMDQRAVWHALERLQATVAPELSAALVVEPTTTLIELMRQIALTDIVVASRFHNIVCAIKLRRPLISLGYAEKNEALLRQIGLYGFSQHIEHFDPELLKDQFLRASAERVEIADRMAVATTNYTQRLVAQRDAVLELLPSCPEHEGELAPRAPSPR